MKILTDYTATASGNFSLCQTIKSRLSLHEAAELCGIQLPRNNRKFCSPLRPDRNPSCSIQGDSFHDWSRDEHLDVISFYASAKGIENAEAIRQLSQHLGITNTAPQPPQRKPETKAKVSQVSFVSREPRDEDLSAILRTRKLPPEAEAGIVLADAVGVLQFTKVGGFDCWLVTDKSRRIAEARRLDGKPFPEVGTLGERKAHTLKGSTKSWPVGLVLDPRRSVDDLPFVLCEGSADFVCAYALLAALPMDAKDFQPLAMLGASARICEEALKQLGGRNGIILAHGDEAGHRAASQWSEQLTAVGCTVTERHLPPGLDLNDCVSLHGLAAAERLVTT